MSQITKPVLLLIPTLLMLLSLVVVYSSSAILGEAQYHDSFFFLKRQAVFVALSFGTIYLGYITRLDFLRKYALWCYLFGLVLLLLVLIPGIGKSAGGAARWIQIGGFRLQGGEVMKLALIIYLATSLAKKSKEMQNFGTGIVAHLIFPGVAMGLLLLEPDLGTAFLLASVSFVLLFLGGARIGYLIGSILLAVPILVHVIATSPYRLGRIIAFLDPWAHRFDVGYQVVESLITFGSGQSTGVGFGLGPSKLFFLPAAHTDFILAVVGEELGFLGIVFLFGLFFLLGAAGLSVALRAQDRFLALLSAGLTSMLILQMLFNVFVVMGLAPTKGVTLPFMSSGGSSMLISALMVGLLLRVDYEGQAKGEQQL